jgi:hypothetical protein
MILAFIVREGETGKFSQSARWQHHDLRTDRRALVKVDEVLVDHADAAGGDN